MSLYLYDSRGYLADGPSIDGLRSARPVLQAAGAAARELIENGVTERLDELDDELGRVVIDDPLVTKSLRVIRAAARRALDVLIITDGVGLDSPTVSGQVARARGDELAARYVEVHNAAAAAYARAFKRVGARMSPDDEANPLSAAAERFLAARLSSYPDIETARRVYQLPRPNTALDDHPRVSDARRKALDREIDAIWKKHQKLWDEQFG